MSTAAIPSTTMRRLRPALSPSRWDWAVVVYVTAYLLSLWFVPQGPGVFREVTSVAYFGICVATIVAQLQLARSPLFDRRTRWGWTGLAAASVCIFVAGVAWTIWLESHPGQPSPTWSDTLTSTYIPCAILGFLAFPREPRTSLRDRRVFLDAILLAVAGLAISWHFSLRPMLVASASFDLQGFISTVGEWIVFAAAATAYLRSQSRVMRTALSLALAAHVGFIVADYFWASFATSYAPGDLVDLSFFTTWVLRWMAARYAWHASEGVRVRGDDDSDVPYRSGITPTAVVTGAYLLLVAVVLGGGGDAVEIAVVCVSLTALLIVRQRTELADNQRLSLATLAQGERFRVMLSYASDYIAVLDDAHRIVWASPSFEHGEGRAIGGLPFSDAVHPDDRADVMRWLTRRPSAGSALPLTCRLRGANAAWSDVELRLEDRRDDPNVRGFVLNGRDVSGERALEGRLRHAEKLVTLHDIAGRIAHAFNNLLAMIAGHAELLAGELRDEPHVLDDIAAIRAATERGAGITRQLVGFSGQHEIQPIRLPVGATIKALAPALGRALPDGITIELSLGDRQVHVLFDRSQFEQVLVNLVANARDAMPTGGVVRVALAVEQLGDSTVNGAQGSGVVICIRDNGVGIPESDLRHIFEPFFTTKAPGLGTGLGLAMVDTIVRRAGGRVTVDSTVGVGTTVSIHLPQATGPTPAPMLAIADAASVRGRGVVLLVDDEAGVRRVSRRILERAGFSVIEAGGGAEAIAVTTDLERRIDILVTDMMMPELSGRDVIEQFSIARPGTPIVVVTGFATESAEHKPLPPDVKVIVAKPFSATIFLRAVSGALGLHKDDAT